VRSRTRAVIASLLAAGWLNAQGGQLADVGTSIEAPGPDGPLRGTLLGPALTHGPVVLIIPGSGPTDRDGNNPLGVRAATYRLLAEGLASRGVSSVRIDKRGLAGSAGAVADGNAVTIDDYVADIGSWIALIRRRTGASCVWLLGHSEGGLVALAAAKISDGCGLVLVSTPGRPMGEVMRGQLAAAPAAAPLRGAAGAIIDSLEAGKRVDVELANPVLQRLFSPQLQGFLISAFSYDPAQLLQGYAKPALILQGERDIQVSEADARLLKRADPNATLVLLADVNHLLKSVTSDDRKANVATYGDPALPLAPGVVDAIAEFLSTAKP
jgi:uncharacterized protein